MVHDHFDSSCLLLYHLFGAPQIVWPSVQCFNVSFVFLKAAQLLIGTAQLSNPDYVAQSWHVYLVYLAMMFLSYVIICLPTRYVSWFNIWANVLGVVVLIISTIILPIKAEKLNSGKEIFTEVSIW